MDRFNVNIDPLWAAPLLLIGATQARSWAKVDDKEVTLKLGIGEETFPLAEVASVEPHHWSWIYGIGLRIGYGGLGFIGSTQGVVKIEFKKPLAFHVLPGIKKRFPRFFVSLEDPQGFIATVQDHIDRADK